MPSKGVDYYSYIGLPNASIAFSGPQVGSNLTSADNFMKSHLEIDSANLPLFTFVGTFEWDVDRNGTTIASREQGINWLTGNLDLGDFTMMLDTPAVLGPDYTITYGFYDAGSGVANLTNADQAWVTIVPKFSDWMGTVAPPSNSSSNSSSSSNSEDEKPFSNFVLAAAHDGGMNTLSGIEVVTDDPVIELFLGALSLLLPIPGITTLLVNDAVNIMEDLSMTQKETFTSMLDNGVRYFDFRPAYLPQAVQSVVAPKDNTLYHTHLIIPGARFDSFLSEVASFLLAHPTEIVVVRISADGIEGVEIPSADVVTQFATTALTGTGLSLGNSSAFQMPIRALRENGTRLILVQNNPKYDSYSDAAYATLDPAPIVASFAAMTPVGQNGNDFTVLQCQGTSTSIVDVLIYGAAVAGGATSTLMATKAAFDMVTLPWIRENALEKFTVLQNIILMNDFIDGATTQTAVEMSMARFAGTTTVPSSVSAKVRREVRRAREDLGKYREKEVLLKGVVAEAEASGAKEEKTGLRVLREAAKEAEDTTEAQGVVLNLAEQHAAATSSSNQTAHASTPKRSNAHKRSESKSPQDQLSSAQADLEKNRAKETLLQSIVANRSAELDAKEVVSDEDRRGLEVLTQAQKEAEQVRKAQEQVVEMAKKKASGGNAEER